MLHGAVVTLFFVALALANLPWLHERVLVFFPAPTPRKPLWLCLLEWLIYYILWLVLSFGVEKKLMGEVNHQGWQFFVITLCLFGVFAAPSFIYRYDLRPHLEKRDRRSK